MNQGSSGEASGRHNLMKIRSLRLTPTRFLLCIYLVLLALGLLASIAVTVVFPMASAAIVIIVTVLALSLLAAWLIVKGRLFGYGLLAVLLGVIAENFWKAGRVRHFWYSTLGPDGQQEWTRYHAGGSPTWRGFVYVHAAFLAVVIVEAVFILTWRIFHRHRVNSNGE